MANRRRDIVERGSQLLERVGRNDVLADAGRELGLDSLIVKNASNWNVEISGGRESSSSLAYSTWLSGL